jgi:lipoprotein
MSNVKRNLAILAVLVVMLTLACPVAVSAKGNTFYSFYFAEKGVDKPCTVYSSKNDNEQQWYLTIYKANPNTGVGSTLSSTNIFLARMNKVGNVSGANHHFVSDEHRISNYIVGYPFQYTYLVDTEMTLYLGGRKTSGSTSTTPLIVSGVYCP